MSQPRCFSKKKKDKRTKDIIFICRWARKKIKEKREDPKGTLPHIYSSPPLLTMHPSINSIVFSLHCFNLGKDCVFYNHKLHVFTRMIQELQTVDNRQQRREKNDHAANKQCSTSNLRQLQHGIETTGKYPTHSLICII